MKTILIIDSDAEVTELLAQFLHTEGYTIITAADGEIGLKKALNQSIDAIIMDAFLPKKNGFEVLQTIREYSNIPVLFLATQVNEIESIIGLEIGADDYLAKPCNPRELIARLKTILNRTQKKPSAKAIIQYHPITLNRSKRQVFIANVELELTNTEFNILEMLMKTPNQAFSKEELTEYALGRQYTAYDRSIDVHISNLRNKLGKNTANEPWLKTVRGFGYMFNI